MERIRLGDICEVLNGFAFKSENYVDSGIRIIRIANVQKGFIEDNTPAFYPIDSEGIDRFMLDEGDLLMSLTGNVGRVAILAKEFLPAALNQRVACLRIKSDRISKRYLFHILNSDFFEQQCIQSAKGVAQKNMSTEWLKEYEIPFYSQSKQKEISNILDNALLIMEERKCQLRTLDTLIKARFVEMFGDLVVGDKISTNKHRIGEFASVTKLAGFEFTKYIQYQEAGEIIMLRGLNCKNGKLVLNDVKWISRETSDLLPRSKLHYGDILITYAGTIGDVAMIDADDRYHLAPNVGKITIEDREHYNPVFLMHLLMYSHDYIMSFASQVAQASINMEKIRNFEYYFPDVEVQKQFAAFVSQIDKSKVAVQAALNKTQLLFDSLMQQYFG